MNLRETRQLLTMLWSMYPNAPKLTREDKDVMAITWLSLMHEYSLQDVWKAVKQCCEREPRFIPTAPEVLAKCVKDYDPEQYLPPEYNRLAETIERNWVAEANRESWYGRLKRTGVENLNKAEMEEYERLVKERETAKKLDRMWHEACEAALNAYDQAERAKLADDGTEQKLQAILFIS